MLPKNTWRPRLLAAGIVASTLAAACGSSSSGGEPSDAGLGGDVFRRFQDSGTSADASAPAPFEGTTGKACPHGDSDCTPDGGAGLNACSSDYTFNVGGSRVQLLTTPVCMVALLPGGAGNCDPAPPSDPQGLATHFCDGPGDDPTVDPGICVPETNPPSPGQGICLPKCSFPIDGSGPAQGCTGKDICQPLPGAFTLDTTTNVVTGYGNCQGFCTSDADCTGLGTGFVCQTDIGFCTKAKVTRTKQLGDACASSTSSTAVDPCNCLTGPSGTGYCTIACNVGGAACPSGWVCDTDAPPVLDFGTSGQFQLTAQASGTEGFCAAPCKLEDAGTATKDSGVASTDASTGPGAADSGSSEAGTPGTGDAAAPSPPPDSGASATASCPAASTCQVASAIGPDCLP